MSKTKTEVVNLPALPRCETDRNKWANDYDRVQNELLKSHLPNASTTLSLRTLPVPMGEWNTTIPSKEEDVLSSGSPNHGSKASKKRHVPSSLKDIIGGATSPGASGMSNSGQMRSPSPLDYSPGRSTVVSPLMQRQQFQHAEQFKCLITLLRPPSGFHTSFKLDTTGIDIGWIVNAKNLNQGRRPEMQTLESIREDRLINPSARGEVCLSSPRSVAVLLNNGVSVDDLQVLPRSHFPRSMPKELVDLRLEHHEARRTELLNALRDEYRSICHQISLVEILDYISSELVTHDNVDTSSFIKDRRKKQESVVEANRHRLQKQIEFNDVMATKMAIAEQKRVAVEQELQQKQAEKLVAMRNLRERTEKKLIALRQSMEHAAVERVQKTEQRRKEIEKKDAERLRICRDQEAAIAEENRRKREKKQERLARNRLHLDEVLDDKRRRQEEKEAIAAERKAKLDRIRESERADIEAKQNKAIKLRELAKQRTEEREKEVARLAKEKHEQAQEQLHAFQQRRAQEAAAKREKEREHAEHRRQAFEQVADSTKKRAEEMTQRRLEHDELLEKIKRDKTLAMQYHKEIENIQRADKQFLVQRQTRAGEFRKLTSVSDIQRKAEKATLLEQQRRELMNMTLQDREKIRREKEMMLSELQSKIKHA